MNYVLGSTPYRWPFDGVLDPARTALVICGSAQEWSSRTPVDVGAESALASLRQLSADTEMLTVLIRHQRPSTRPVTALPVPSSPVMVAQGRELETTAAGIDGFYGSDLDPLLRRNGRSHLLLAGRGLETAVHSTLRRANDRGYECVTVADACSAVDENCRVASISSIEMSGGIFGAVATTEAVVAAYLAHQPIAENQ